tara:strand:- start:374 stop:742 length:369 start_codon:yes stop_codon:yes gene_type:complete
MNSLTGLKFSSIKHNDMSFDARVEATPEVVQEETPQVLTISQLVSHIKDDGMSRDEIRKKYGLTIAEAKEIFSHPKLKGIRVKRQRVMRIQLIDDTAPQQMTLQQGIAEVDPHSDNQDENED